MIAERNFFSKYKHTSLGIVSDPAVGEEFLCEEILIYKNNVTNSMISQTLNTTDGRAQKEESWPPLQ